MRNAFAVIAVLLISISHAKAADIVGVPQILDGDTVKIGNTKIRLLGIDSPETDQMCLRQNGESWACGVSARDALVSYAGGKEWTCHPSRKDRFRRTLAKCEVNGENIQQWMVRSGWAMSYVKYSHAYDSEETEARASQVGLWAGAFIAPWAWRNRGKNTEVQGAAQIPSDAQHKLLSAISAAGAPSSDCAIKGNVNKAGECIFHQPGGRWYAKVDMSLHGKRWFCSVAEAEAAGCRATRR